MRYGKIPNAFLASWNIDVNLPLEKCWDYISNTDRINKAIGSGEVYYKEVPNEKGGSTLYGRIKNAGLTSQYREYPYEWIENQFVAVYRTYLKGPLKTMTFDMEIVPRQVGFSVRYTLQFELKTKLLFPVLWFEVYKKAIPKFKEAYKHLENYFQNKESNPFPVSGFEPLSRNPKLKAEYQKRFKTIPAEENLKEKIINFLLDSPDLDLLKIRPYKLAKLLQEDKKKVLEFFLRSTKAGLMDMNWDILCPSCRGAKSSSHHLFELSEKVHCPSCNIEYGPDFDKSVELTFTPNPSLRKVEAHLHCFGGPGTTPHLRAQIRLKSNSKESFSFTFQEGKYRIFSLQEKSILYINVDRNNPPKQTIQYPMDGTISISNQKTTLEFSNTHDYEIVVKLEKANWLEDITTASEVTALQEFRDLFSSEVLKPGQEIGIQSLSILFTDLKGSTKFYNEKGDALAYTFVREHFELLTSMAYNYNGAIVKTIGDAIMAVFTLPINAFRYAIDSQKGMEKLNQKYKLPEIKLKLGIHFGPVLAVTMNEKLDYFGTTVNLAARTQDKSLGGDIVVTENFFNLDEIQKEIQKNKLSYEKFTVELKGFSESYSLVRIYP